MNVEELDYDVLIAGSGPIGSTYARLILEHNKDARVLMVEVGAQESAVIGANLKNAIKYQKDLDAFSEPHDEELEMCPIERGAMRNLLQYAKKLLNVHEDQFEHSIRHQLVKKTLLDAFASQGRTVKSLPLAGERSHPGDEYITWSGADTVLGDFVSAKDERGEDRFKLLTECLVVKFVLEGDKVAGALVRDLRAGQEHIIKAKAYVAACGVVCTPQLLWNSNIHHKALGHYLTDQSHTFCQIVLRRTLIDKLRDPNSGEQGDSPNTLPIPLNDPDPQITIPYSTEYPYHTQLHRDAFSYGDVGPQIDHRVVLDLRFFGRVDVRESNFVSFSDKDQRGHTNTDVYGMPQATFHFRRSSDDEQRAQKMMKDISSYVSNESFSDLPDIYFQKASWYPCDGHDPSRKRSSYFSS
ncbi:Pyranose 2-oxidase [Ceratobasidium sp. 414]|nr:Pyranose 2-oxidase [Ceratobasidium sp. 414]